MPQSSKAKKTTGLLYTDDEETIFATMGGVELSFDSFSLGKILNVPNEDIFTMKDKQARVNLWFLYNRVIAKAFNRGIATRFPCKISCVVPYCSCQRNQAAKLKKKLSIKEKSLALKAAKVDSSEEDEDSAYLTKRFQKHKVEYKDYARNNTVKGRRRDQIPEKFKRRATADYAVKKTLVALDEPSNKLDMPEGLEDASMIVVED
ncbi:hypothetical protein HAX54_051530 [Datura stramonium]|uniref:Uncharacterized protein n=1 Tax=Datura stramonium TaxID=4076 RepID=A0ABS8WRE6_DATST|nr:hypothetical protein [Datura stramonium]